MKICILAENYVQGGVDTFIKNLVMSWPVDHDDISIVCNLNHPGITSLMQQLSVKSDFHLYSNFSTKYSKYCSDRTLRTWLKFPLKIIYHSTKYTLQAPCYVLYFYKFFISKKYDHLIVVNGGYPASLICRLSIIAFRLSNMTSNKNKILLSFHNYSVKDYSFFGSPQYFIDKIIEKNANYIVSVTNDCLQSIRNRKAFANSRKLVHIANGVWTNIERRHHKHTSNSIRLITLASYEPRKGHKILIQAIKLLLVKRSDIYLECYGQDINNYKKELIEFCHEQGLLDHISFNDFAKDITPLIKNSAILIAPSQEYESFGYTIIEAMALETPVIASDLPAFYEVDDNTGSIFFCDKSSPSSFCAGILKVIESEALRNQLIKSGLELFERSYTSRAMSSKYRKLLSSN